ncbi:hypothetical protein NH340_JMT02631 [Sarcoptes scabiei]|nr:hypothetical protein NH340_JMT02631 [Sarcoptes scabiei]
MMLSSSKNFISLLLILSILIFDNILIQNYQIPVRIIDKKFNNEFNYKELDFVRIDNDLREQSAVNKTKTILSDGPEIYQTLKNLCFFFEDQKYFFRICLFDNVTQHDKSRYFYRSFHALLGVWQEWYTDLDDFGSGFLFYDHGMECHGTDQHGFRRKVGVKFECEKQSDRDKDYDDDDDEEFVKVVDVREIKKCVYLIHIQSFIFCGKFLLTINLIEILKSN